MQPKATSGPLGYALRLRIIRKRLGGKQVSSQAIADVLVDFGVLELLAAAWSRRAEMALCQTKRLSRQRSRGDHNRIRVARRWLQI